ncbi:hypothetical protein DNTS_013400 [Danionella cerebrum]|uniref:Uncharacterized protein n=1 Tax=Danionella cerebrum TaxID=2873325 RepID=A0A553PW93_9TELE|nr:hypothetical protein DNTS_013400 [Danionella translucida]
MSCQKGNLSRSRGQKHQNLTAYRNDKHGASLQIKRANAKVHDGLCRHCKDVLEWKVKYNKYKTLTQPRKCFDQKEREEETSGTSKPNNKMSKKRDDDEDDDDDDDDEDAYSDECEHESAATQR